MKLTTENVNNGGPAFPVPLTDEQELDYDILNGNPHGMSLRDYFAAKAMQALVPVFFDEDFEYLEHEVAAYAYRTAYAMLEARHDANGQKSIYHYETEIEDLKDEIESLRAEIRELWTRNDE